MIFIINTLIFGLIVNTINIPFDGGANVLGSKNSPKILEPYLDFLNIDKKININVDNFITNIISDGHESVLSTLKDNKLPITIGGDHTVAVASVSAVNRYCNLNNKSLGILWCDAHADFNTIETSPTKNIHGMPVAILCGHTLQTLKISNSLFPEQFLFYGVRDIDSLEFKRFQEYNMAVLEDNDNIDEWINKFDLIHISFDIDCLDSSVTKCVNTPVKNGKSINQIKNLFNKVKLSNKLCSLDIVEYNYIYTEDPKIIINIVKELF